MSIKKPELSGFSTSALCGWC